MVRAHIEQQCVAFSLSLLSLSNMYQSGHGIRCYIGPGELDRQYYRFDVSPSRALDFAFHSEIWYSAMRESQLLIFCGL